MNTEKTKKIFKAGRVIGNDLKLTLKRELESYQMKPSAALLFLTYRCTSKCTTCTMWKRPKNKEAEVSLDGWKHIIDKLYKNGLTAVEPFGGDVLLRKDVLFPLLHYLKKRNFIIHLPTNCNLLDKETAEDLVNSEVDFIYLSMDGINTLHDRIRGVEGTFDKVKRVLDFLVKARSKKKANNNKPKIICNTTVSRDNLDQLDSITEFASKAGYDEIHLEYVGEMTEEQVNNSTINSLKPEPYFLKQNESSLITQEQVKVLRDKLKAIKKRYTSKDFGITTINIDILSDSDLVNGTVSINKCYMARREVTIDPFGNMIVCPFFNNYYLGNLLEQEYEDIWNGEKHKKFLLCQKSGKLEICNHCILSAQRNHSFFTGLKRIYKTRVEQNWARLFKE